MKSKKPYNAIILASEITKGMKSIGSKALLNINNNTTVIDYQIHMLKRFYHPINIYICTGFDHDKLVKKTNKYKDIYYVYNPNFVNDNQVASLSMCLNQYSMDDAIIITNGVLLGEKPQIERGKSSIFLTDNTRKHSFDIGVNSNSDINYLFYDLPFKWSECAYLNQQSIQTILSINKEKQLNRLFLFELINIISEKQTLNSISLSKNTATKINGQKDISTAKKYYEKYLCSKI